MKLELSNYDNGLKFITWSELREKEIDGIRYYDIHEVTISDTEMNYVIYDMKGEAIKMMKGYKVF